ncbi:MAG: hypothetical protein FJ100_18180 [Deltaproteobacteria bacterium]|nr:hypothetical protein [Deltaproteobacteria bacterium]
MIDRSYRSLAALAAVALSHLTAAPAAAEPMTLALQGRLLSVAGGPVPDGDYAMAVGLFPQPTGGSAVFEESFLAVTVQYGVFAQSLGAGKVALDAVVFSDGKPLWVGVTIGKDELARVPLSRVAFAAQASYANAAKFAADVQCSGCVSGNEIDPAALAGLALKSELAKVASTGKYADLDGAPKLADVALSGNYGDLQGLPAAAKVGTACGSGLWVKGLKADGSLDCAAVGDFLPLKGGTVTGTLTVDGELALGGSAVTGGHFGKVDVAKTTCGAANHGQVAVGGANGKLYYCDGKAWQRLATCTPQCPDPGLVACGQSLTDNCGDPCTGSGTFCAALQTCTNGKCTAPLGALGNPVASCQALKTAVPTAPSALYWLDPDGGSAANAFETWCEMTLGGGGWTLLAVIGTNARPTQFTGGNAPRAGATFYGKASAATGDILNPTKNNSGMVHFSVQGKVLFENSANREVMAWNGGDADDYLKVSLPKSCNPFDPGVNCAEDTVTGLTLTDGSGKVITTGGQMCTAIGDPCGFNEVGFHLLDGKESHGNCQCHQGAANTGSQGIGRMWTTFHRADGGHWNNGVHSAWKGSFNQPGALLIR